jgi:hypothetical protein
MASRLVLAEVTGLEGRFRGQGNGVIAVVAWPDREYYGGGFGPEPELWEDGTCPGCGVNVVSTAKRATCPVCANPCQLT